MLRIKRLHEARATLDGMWRTAVGDRMERIERAYRRIVARIYLERIDLNDTMRAKLLAKTKV